jgi:ureidoacrylate peracid hydrolase
MIEAQPASIQIDPARTAVLVINMQNDFGAKGGMFDRAGIDISMIQWAVVPTAARQAGIAVIYLKMAFQPALSDAGPTDAPSWDNRLQPMPSGVGCAPASRRD